MVHYKIHYFNSRGAAEPLRQILVVAGQEFEDVRVSQEDWPQLKASTPFGQMPVLEEDGKKLGQSTAIARYLARKYKLAGSNPWEEAQVDAYVDQMKDFLTECRPHFVVFAGHAPGSPEDAQKELFAVVQKHFPFFVKAIEKNGSGYLVGNSLTFADLMLAEYSNTFSSGDATFLEAFPVLKEHKAKVQSNPQLKKWIETRPVTRF